jgi:hypothetical protein
MMKKETAFVIVEKSEMDECGFSWFTYIYILDAKAPQDYHKCGLPKGHEKGELHKLHECKFEDCNEVSV